MSIAKFLATRACLPSRDAVDTAAKEATVHASLSSDSFLSKDHANLRRGSVWQHEGTSTVDNKFRAVQPSAGVELVLRL